MVYQVDISKSNQEGLSSRKKKPKKVYQYANEQDLSRCFVQLYKLYNSKCPETRPSNAFYLTPLPNPKLDVLYSRTSLGYKSLSKVVSEMMKKAGLEGHFTNQSLRVSSAMRGCLMKKSMNT